MRIVYYPEFNKPHGPFTWQNSDRLPHAGDIQRFIEEHPGAFNAIMEAVDRVPEVKIPTRAAF